MLQFYIVVSPGGKHFLADTLSRLPQYNSSKSKEIRLVVPSQKLEALAIASGQGKLIPQMLDELPAALKTPLEGDCTLCDG